MLHLSSFGSFGGLSYFTCLVCLDSRVDLSSCIGMSCLGGLLFNLCLDLSLDLSLDLFISLNIFVSSCCLVDLHFAGLIHLIGGVCDAFDTLENWEINRHGSLALGQNSGV